MPSETHDEFLKLCALFVAGDLSDQEQRKLEDHLALCAGCREALAQYRALAGEIVPTTFGSDDLHRQLNNIDPGPDWSESQAQEELFRRLAQGEKSQSEDASSLESELAAPSPMGIPPSTELWPQVWKLGGAVVLLGITLGLSLYWFGHGRSNSDVGVTTKSSPQPSTQQAPPQVGAVFRKSLIDQGRVADRERQIQELRQQLEAKSAALTQLHREVSERDNIVSKSSEVAREDSIPERNQFSNQLQETQAEARALQVKVDALTSESLEQSAHYKALENKVTELGQQLHERETLLAEKNELLAHDRDIRELIGARDLYIAEVYDVADNGKTRRPYGRVFYTKGKSLVFYAYDLDQQGLRHAETFQAWGRRGPDRGRALSLGVLSRDNAGAKRWILKFNDPKTLSQIDAVFVTVEPEGGSEKPSGKPLLFTYLRVDPNHP